MLGAFSFALGTSSPSVPAVVTLLHTTISSGSTSMANRSFHVRDIASPVRDDY
jgi:hypothetical protein